MSQIILAVAEQADGTPRKIAGEVCSQAVRLAQESGGEAIACTIGPGAAQAAAALGDFGIAKAVAVEGDAVSSYSGESYAKAIADVAKNKNATVVFLGATSFSRDLLGRVGAHLGVSPAADCTAVDGNGGNVLARRPVYAGKAILTVSFDQAPAVISLRPNVFGAEAGKGASTEVETTEAAAPERMAKLVEKTASEGGKLDVSEAEVIVAGGRGMKDPETFSRLLEPLAEVLGAAVGSSRAVVDAGWRPHAEQVGQTGKTVAPKLYIACGISGRHPTTSRE